MKGKLASYYRSKKNGRPIFVFEVTGTDDELKKYTETIPEFDESRHTSEDGNPLYWSVNPYTCQKVGDTIDLTITINGNVVVDDMESAIAIANRIEQQRENVMAGERILQRTVEEAEEEEVVEV